MSQFIPLTGSEKPFLIDSNYITGPRLQDINVNTVRGAWQSQVQNQAGTALVPCLILLVRLPNKNSLVFYYFNSITVDQYLSYLVGLSVTTTLVKYANCIAIQTGKFATPTDILLDETKIGNKVFNEADQTTDFYVDFNNGSTKIFTFAGNLTEAAGGPVTATLAIPLITTPIAGDTIIFTMPDGTVTAAYEVTDAHLAAVYAGLQSFVTNNLPFGYSYTDTLASQVDTFLFTSPDPGVDFAGLTISIAVTGTTFGASPVTATFS